MGKSTAAQLLRSQSIPVVDTDDLARQVVEPGQPALAEIQEKFGSEMIGPNGQLRREALAQRVFSDDAARQTLENILHPRIRQLWRAQVAEWKAQLPLPRGEGRVRAAQSRALAVVIIPLLFETKAQDEFDATVCLACSAATQQQRLLARGWSLEQIRQRLRAQWPVEQKMALADFVVWTEAGLDVHAAQLARIILYINSASDGESLE
ncbi:Dephospho-CoA kinase [Verrucomicrobia bacterium]|nr:Dephospho-CoA kinase [Verrucomicrobiota bacterium]